MLLSCHSMLMATLLLSEQILRCGDTLMARLLGLLSCHDILVVKLVSQRAG